MPQCLGIFWLRVSRFMAEKIICRIDGVLKVIKQVQSRVLNVSCEEFINNNDLSEAVSFNIFLIGERMNKLEELLADKYPHLPWKEARGMRNIIAHDYDNVNFKKVYLTATRDLPVLKKELLKIKDDINQTHNYLIETDRLLLRPWNDFDADELFELAKDPEIGNWCGWEPHKHIRDSFFALHNFLEVEETYAIVLKEKEIIVGSIGLSFKGNTLLTDKDDECELGFWIGKPFWNNGYATEAGLALIERAFNKLNMKVIWCGYYEGNESYKHIQEKLGFRFHHKTENQLVPQLKIHRTSYINCLNKEKRG